VGLVDAIRPFRRSGREETPRMSNIRATPPGLDQWSEIEKESKLARWRGLDAEGDEKDPADSDCRRCEEGFFRFTCINKRTKDGLTRSC